MSVEQAPKPNIGRRAVSFMRNPENLKNVSGAAASVNFLFFMSDASNTSPEARAQMAEAPNKFFVAFMFSLGATGLFAAVEIIKDHIKANRNNS